MHEATVCSGRRREPGWVVTRLIIDGKQAYSARRMVTCRDLAYPARLSFLTGDNESQRSFVR